MLHQQLLELSGDDLRAMTFCDLRNMRQKRGTKVCLRVRSTCPPPSFSKIWREGRDT